MWKVHFDRNKQLHLDDKVVRGVTSMAAEILLKHHEEANDIIAALSDFYLSANNHCQKAVNDVHDLNWTT